MHVVRMFDVDWLAGMSFGMFPLKDISPKHTTAELYNYDACGLSGC